MTLFHDFTSYFENDNIQIHYVILGVLFNKFLQRDFRFWHISCNVINQTVLLKLKLQHISRFDDNSCMDAWFLQNILKSIKFQFSSETNENSRS